MGHPILEYSEITPLISIGTNMCCDVHGARLADEGFAADIDLEDSRQELPPEVQTYLWLPTPDNRAPTIEQLLVGVHALHQLVRAGQRTYVHCTNGHGRSPTLVIAYFITTGLGLQEAYHRVWSKRPEIHLHKEQEQALQEFERRYRGTL